MLCRSSSRWSNGFAASVEFTQRTVSARIGNHVVYSRNATPYFATRRTLTAGTVSNLPRQVVRTFLASDAAEDKQHQLQHVQELQQQQPSDSLPISDPSVPWFLQAEHVDPPEHIAQPEIEASLSSSELDKRHFEFLPLNPSVPIPSAIYNLQHQLLNGPAANLIARPPSQDEDLPSPITFIHPASLSLDPGNDAYGSNDWIVIVQARSSAAGIVRKVAIDVGKFLKNQRPPQNMAPTQLDVDDILGPIPSSPRNKNTSTSSSDKPVLAPRPKGVSRIEHELGKSLPDWAIHRIALKKKFPDGWKPPKVLSREAQDGIRLIHNSDPEQFNVKELSARFRISKESVRRILKAGDRHVSGEQRSRQDRRAHERVEERVTARTERLAREDAEMAELRKVEEQDGELATMQEQDQEFLEDGESPIIEGEDDLIELESSQRRNRSVQPVRFEGLTTAAPDSASSGPSTKSKGQRGDGHWCLVDAEWCMVHVMTETARFKYDIEGMWREIQTARDTNSSVHSNLAQSHAFVKAPTRRTTQSRKSIFGKTMGKVDPSQGNYRFFATSSRLSSSIVALTPPQIELPETINQMLNRTAPLLSQQTTNPAEAIPIVVQGWLSSVRKQKNITFLEITDGTLPAGRTLQAVFKNTNGKDRQADEHDTSVANSTSGLTVGTALRLEGHLKTGKGSKKGQNVELAVTQLQVVGSCDPTYPLSSQQMHQNSVITCKKENSAVSSTEKTNPSEPYHASEAERRSPHLRARLPRHAAVLRTRQRLERSMSEWLENHDFVKVTAPIITSSDCEGAGEVFQVVADSDIRSANMKMTTQESNFQLSEHLSPFWSNQPAYLTVSSQLHLEAMGLGLSRVWTLNPSFRAEGSSTNRHLAEFWMLETEMYWTEKGSLSTLMDCAEAMLKTAIRSVISPQSLEDLTFLSSQNHIDFLSSLIQPNKQWIRISYTDVIQLLTTHYSSTNLVDETLPPPPPPPIWGQSLSSDHERWIASFFQSPVFVTDFPSCIKPFYMRQNDQQGQEGKKPTVACFDLLIPRIGELIGGSLREERIHRLQENLNQLGLSNPITLKWYLQDLRKFGTAPHGGFGMGMERLLAWITHTENVRDVTTFPRTKGLVRF